MAKVSSAQRLGEAEHWGLTKSNPPRVTLLFKSSEAAVTANIRCLPSRAIPSRILIPVAYRYQHDSFSMAVCGNSRRFISRSIHESNYTQVKVYGFKYLRLDATPQTHVSILSKPTTFVEAYCF